jgi:Flp pilus assembly protein TadG
LKQSALKKFLSRTDGAAAIEFVLIAPILLLLFAGLVNIGLRVYQQSLLDQAVREAAQAAMFTQDKAVLNQTLNTALAGSGTASPVAIICFCPAQADIRDCTVAQSASCPATGLPWEIAIEISAQADYRPLIPLPGFDATAVLLSTIRVQVR